VKRYFRNWSRDCPAAHGEDCGETGCPPEDHEHPWWSRHPPAAH